MRSGGGETRGARYRPLREFFLAGRDDDDQERERDREETRLGSVFLAEGAFAVGQTVDDLAVERSGAEVMAIRRRDVKTREPSPDTRFAAGDVVVLLGEPEALALAEERLLKG